MEVITLQSEAYKELLNKLEEINTRLNSKEKDSKEKWLDNQEFLNLLKISKRTAQSYRDTGIISFSQIGSKIYYKLSDVEEMMKSHYNKAYRK